MRACIRVGVGQLLQSIETVTATAAFEFVNRHPILQRWTKRGPAIRHYGSVGTHFNVRACLRSLRGPRRKLFAHVAHAFGVQAVEHCTPRHLLAPAQKQSELHGDVEKAPKKSAIITRHIHMPINGMIDVYTAVDATVTNQ